MEKGCSDVKDSRSELSAHVYQMHSRFLCDHCFASYLSVKAKKDHMKKHEAGFPCAECGKMFAYESGLRDHGKVHTTDRSEKCETCGAEFKRKSELKAHIESKHAVDRQAFSCQTCPKKFATKKLLSQHMRVHGEKKFTCGECDAKFKYTQQVKRHAAKHHAK